MTRKEAKKLHDLEIAWWVENAIKNLAARAHQRKLLALPGRLYQQVTFPHPITVRSGETLHVGVADFDCLVRMFKQTPNGCESAGRQVVLLSDEEGTAVLCRFDANGALIDWKRE